MLQIPLKVVAGDVRVALSKLRAREPTSIGKVERRRGLVHNQPVISGTRIPVRSVKAFAAAGFSIDQIRTEYPSLTEEDVRAALAYDSAA